MLEGRGALNLKRKRDTAIPVFLEKQGLISIRISKAFGMDQDSLSGRNVIGFMRGISAKRPLRLSA